LKNQKLLLSDSSLSRYFRKGDTSRKVQPKALGERFYQTIQQKVQLVESRNSKKVPITKI